MKNFVDAALVQIGWFACVGGAAQGLYWLGPSAVAAMLAFHLLRSANRRRDLLVVALLGAAGTVLDSLQSAAGLLAFRGAPSPWICAPWITALWLHFGVAVIGPLASLASRPWAAALLGAVGGPAAYAAGVRWGAASFHPEWQLSVVSIAVVWGAVFPLALRFVHPNPASVALGEPSCAPSS